MLKSRKFWIPVVISLLINGVFLLQVLASLGFPSKPGDNNTQWGNLIFPYMFFFLSGLSALLGRCSMCVTLAIGAFLFQIPLYGFVVGYAFFNDNLLKIAGILISAHFIVYLIASWLSG